MPDYQQTVDLRGKIEKQKKNNERPKPPIGPLEKIYQAEGEAKSKADLKKIYQPEIRKPRLGLIKLIVFILAIMAVSAAAYFLKKSPGNTGQDWYAVKLVNGEIFYGQIADTKADPVVMKNVYYDYDQAKGDKKEVSQTGNIRLVKRGQETYGPAGTMDIVRAQVLFMEPMKDDSKVLKAILEYEK